MPGTVSPPWTEGWRTPGGPRGSGSERTTGVVVSGNQMGGGELPDRRTVVRNEQWSEDFIGSFTTQTRTHEDPVDRLFRPKRGRVGLGLDTVRPETPVPGFLSRAERPRPVSPVNREDAVCRHGRPTSLFDTAGSGRQGEGTVKGFPSRVSTPWGRRSFGLIDCRTRHPRRPQPRRDYLTAPVVVSTPPIRSWGDLTTLESPGWSLYSPPVTGLRDLSLHRGD